ncbi:MAG: GGDEF domain-containing protein [Thalassobaculaceae bacterium]|nr:GGDEF domain-containing protein [Thalassobaculaceae bacterium]
MREDRHFDQWGEAEDPLSGLIGRYGFTRRARRCLGLQLRSASALMMVEIDHFDATVARFGSDCGDMVIRGVAQQLQHMVRGQDVVGRIDATTFAVLHTDIDLAAVRVVGDRLRRSIQSMGFYAEDGGLIPVTVSIGIDVIVRTGRPEALDLAAVLSRAADRVAQARGAGCNRVVAADAAIA